MAGFKVVAIPVVVRFHPEHGWQVHTQKRHVINKDYDPLYDNTFETCGETAKEGESIIETALRGCFEELGATKEESEKFELIDPEIGDFFTGEFYTTGKKDPDGNQDEILGFAPIYFVQQLSAPQPWIGPVFIVQVPPDFEPRQDKEGETAGHQWWNPTELYDLIQSAPEKFMGLHLPAIKKVCEQIME